MDKEIIASPREDLEKPPEAHEVTPEERKAGEKLLEKERKEALTLQQLIDYLEAYQRQKTDARETLPDSTRTILYGAVTKAHDEMFRLSQRAERIRQMLKLDQ